MLRLSKSQRIAALVVSPFAVLVLATVICLHAPPRRLASVYHGASNTQFLDRDGHALNMSYQNRWNLFDQKPLYEIPDLVRQAFVISEDKRFYAHHGVDWLARMSAVKSLALTGTHHRGASTITEQVVRMLYPRPRTVWSRWLEGWEALWLESRAGKAEIFEFYLNQVPYASHRRGIAQAARYYFDRDLDTLTPKEIMALIVLVRAPSRWDPFKNPDALDKAAARLAVQLQNQNVLTAEQSADSARQKLVLAAPTLPLSASHFIRYAQSAAGAGSDRSRLATTLDSNLQSTVQKLLDQRIAELKNQHVQNGAVLIANHQSGEILAWAVAGGDGNDDTPAHQINAVLTPRQPGSAMKPFLYASALEKGWTAATLIDDAPKAAPIRTGLHHFRNYSHIYYGAVTLREALGNSLNIPALLAIDFVSPNTYLKILHDAGFASLGEDAAYYDEGLALGNGAVSLFEMVQGFAMLAEQGQFHALKVLRDEPDKPSRQVFSPEVTSLIGNILSDPWARQWEFGADSVLRLPVQTAIKTGTSNDYHDAWTVGYDSQYVVGVWLGNLDNTPMDRVKGASGPALIARGLFKELNKDGATYPLPVSDKLVREPVCVPTLNSNAPVNDKGCMTRLEYFVKGTEPSAQKEMPAKAEIKNSVIEIAQPTPGLMMAYDPRLPGALQAFEFRLKDTEYATSVGWFLNDEKIATTINGSYKWKLKRGRYNLYAIVDSPAGEIKTAPTLFLVK